MIIVVLSQWLYWQIFNILEYFNSTSCLTICYMTLIGKKLIICDKSRLQHMRCAIARAHLCLCLKRGRPAKKSTPCLIKKASRCVTDHASKTTTFFIFRFLYNAKILQENLVYLFVIWLVQWWKLYYVYIFFSQKTTDFERLKRNMSDGTIVFLTSLLIALTRNILLLFSFRQKIISCFE